MKMEKIIDNKKFQEFLKLLEIIKNEENDAIFCNFLNELHASVLELIKSAEINKNEDYCKTRIRGLMRWTGEYDSFPKAIILYNKLYDIHQNFPVPRQK